MKKKGFIVLAFVMLLSLLSVGCGTKIPTAQELVDNGFATLPTDKSNVTLEVIMDMSASSDALGESISVGIYMEMELDIKSTAEVSYSYGDIYMEMFGLEVNQSSESYVDMKEGITYTLTDKTWYKEKISDEELLDVSEDKINKLRSEAFTDLVLVENEDKESTEWVVTGIIDYSNIMEALGSQMSDLAGDSVETSSLSELRLQVEMTYDKETQKLKSMKCSCSEENLDEMSTNSVTYEAYEFTYIIHDTDDLVVEVPEDVKTSAIEMSTN